MRHGAEGYALYWYCIELIAARVAPDNITFELKHDSEILGYQLKIDTLKVEKIMLDMINIGLFEASGDRITCLKLAKRLDNTLSQSKEIKETLSNFNKLSPEENRLEEKREEKENKRVIQERFEIFWENYPLKKSKAKANAIFLKIKPDQQLLETMINSLNAQKIERESLKNQKLFAPEWKHPNTWLNGACWEDEVTLTEKPAEPTTKKLRLWTNGGFQS